MKVREARFEDFEQIEALSRRFDLEVKTFNDWAHLWKENPISDPSPIGWVLETAEQKIAGYLGNVPLLYEFEGRTLHAAATHLWVVEESARRHSILLLNKFLNQKVDLLLNTTANLEAQKIFEAFHAHRVPARDYDIALFWITEPYGFAVSLLKKKNVPLARLLSMPLGAFLSLRCPTAKVDPGITEQTSFGPQFDVFWESLRRQSSEVLCHRSQRWLKWHFKDALAQKRLMILTQNTPHKLESYGLFLRHHSRALGLTRMRLVDYQSLDNNCASLGPMVDVALDKCREEKIHMLESIGFGEKKRAILESKHPRRRRLPSWTFFFKSKDASLTNQLTQPELWDPTIYDGDASL